MCRAVWRLIRRWQAVSVASAVERIAKQSMQIAVIGRGGREHALAWRLRKDGHTVTVLPGSAGHGTSIPVDLSSVAAVANALLPLQLDLVVVGPEAPLALGLADALRAAGLAVVGPGAEAAQLEASKIWAKSFMKRHGVPTAAWQPFAQIDEALAALDNRPAGPVVVKLSGLAAGKGSVVCADLGQARQTLEEMEKTHGTSAPCLLEERLYGRELSLMALVADGKAVLLPTAEDYKPLLDGDQGPNTGGMGAISPVPWCTDAMVAQINAQLLQPTLRGLVAEHLSFRGVLYLGVLWTAQGPQLLEYNVRLGDPETQAVLPGLAGDFAHDLLAIAQGNLPSSPLPVLPGFRVAVVLAAPGYPHNLDSKEALGSLPELPGHLFHAGTAWVDGQWQLASGRVLTCVGWGDTPNLARKQAYNLAERLRPQGLQSRGDIGLRWPPLRAALLFSGRGSNVAALAVQMRQGVLRGLIDPVLALTDCPEAPGQQVAQQFGIPWELVDGSGLGRQTLSHRLLDKLQQSAIDVVILAGFQRILSPELVQAYAGRIVNIHPADTWRHQGLDGYAWAWRNRLTKTMVTVHLVDEGVDTGPILAQAVVDLHGVDSVAAVEARGLPVEHALFSRALADWVLADGPG